MANGQVVCGFLNPIYGVYNSSGEIDNRLPLARGVSVSVTPSQADLSNYYANNGIEETVQGTVSSADVTLTLDGLKWDALDNIFGVGDSTQAWQKYTSESAAKNCAIGFLMKVCEDGVFYYVPVLLTNVIFKFPNDAANTKGETIEFQTMEISGKCLPCSDKSWKQVGTRQQQLGDWDPESHSGTGVTGAIYAQMGTLTI